MYLSEFYSCCGASILHEFRWDDGDIKMSEARIARTTDEIILTCRNKGRGMIVAILNNLQIKNGVEQALLGAGFKKVGKTTTARRFVLG